MSESQRASLLRDKSIAAYLANVGVLGMFQAIHRLRGLILLPVIANSMGTAAYGVWTQCLVIVIIGSTFLGLKLPSALVRFVSGTGSKEEQKDIFIPQVALVTVLGIGVSALVAANARGASLLFFGDASYAGVAGWLGMWLSVATLGGLALHLQLGLQRVRLFGAVTTGISIAQLVVVGIVSVVTARLETVVICAMAVEALATALALTLGLRELGLSWPRLGDLRSSLAYSLPLVPSHYGGVVLNHADRIFVTWQLGPEAVAVYAAARSLASVIGEIFSPIKTALIPAASRLWDRGEIAQGKELLTQTLRFYIMIALPALAGAAIVGPSVLEILAEQMVMHETNWLIFLLAVGFLIGNLQTVFGVLLHMAKNTRPLALSKVIAALVFLPVASISITRWGLMGGAAASLVGYSVDLLVTGTLVWPQNKFRLPYGDSARAAAAAAGMVLLLLPLGLGGTAGSILAVLVGIVSYFMLLFILGGLTRGELGELWAIIRSMGRGDDVASNGDGPAI